MNTPTSPKVKKAPSWWDTLRHYLTEEQQRLFIDCYNFLFNGEHSRDILWCFANSMGLLGVIFHNILAELKRTSSQSAELHKATLELEYSIRSGTEAMKDAALRAHEASRDLRNSTMPWEKVVTICVGCFVAVLVATLIEFSVLTFHDHLQQQRIERPPLSTPRDTTGS